MYNVQSLFCGGNSCPLNGREGKNVKQDIERIGDEPMPTRGKRPLHDDLNDVENREGRDG